MDKSGFQIFHEGMIWWMDIEIRNWILSWSFDL